MLNKIVKYWLPPFLWASIIFIFSSQPTGSASQIYITDFIIKKTAHVVFYGVLSGFLYRGFINNGVPKYKSGVLAIVLSALYGLSDEFHQSFTPGRRPRSYDVGFDTIGATLAIYLIWNKLQKMPKPLKDLAKKLEVI